MTIKEKIALLEKMLRNTEKCAETFRRKGDSDGADLMDAEAQGVREALWLFTDDEWAKQARDTYADD